MDEGYALIEIFYADDGRMDVRYLEINPAFERLTALSGARGKTASELNIAIAPHWEEACAHVVHTHEPVRIETYSAALQRWYSVYLTFVEGDSPNTVAALFTDITDRREAAHRLEAEAARNAYRVRLADALRPLDDPVQMLTEASRILGEHLNVQRVVFAEMEGPDAIIHQEYIDGVISFVGRYSTHLFGEALIEVMRRGETLVVGDVFQDPSLTDEQRETYRTVQITAFVTASRVKDGRLVAALSMHSAQPRTWQADEIALLEETADRMWDAAERARAQAALRAREALQRFLLRLSDATRTLSDPFEIIANTTDMLAEALGADRVFFSEIDTEKLVIERDHARGRSSLVGTYPLDRWGRVVLGLYQHGSVTVVNDIGTNPLFATHDMHAFRELGITSGILVPLPQKTDRGVLLAVASASPRVWTDEEIHIAVESAERTCAAVERVRATAALRESEALLQKAFSAPTVGMLFFTLDGRITDVNEAFVRMSGYTRDALLKMDWHRLTDPAFEDVTAHSTEALLRTGETPPYEKQMVRRDGTRWWAMLAPTRLNGHGENALCVEFVLDITSQKTIEVYEREQRLLAEALRETAAELASTLKLTEVLQRGLSSARRMLVYDAAFIVLMDAHQRMVQFHAEGLTQAEYHTVERWHGEQDDLTATALYGAGGPALPVQQITDRALVRLLFPRAGGHALVVVPLLQPRVIGYMVCVQRQPQPLTVTRAAALQAFAYQLTTAIGNARVFLGAQELAALKERQQFARDLHDAVSQTLFTASLMIETLARLVPDGSPLAMPMLTDIQRLIRGAQAEMRSLLLELRPANLETTPLKRLFAQLIDAVRGRKHIEITLDFEDEPELPFEVRVVIYRIVQEALNNVSRHAHAEHAWIGVDGGPGTIWVRVRDDGGGFTFDPERPTAGLGLQMMRERADEISAQLSITSAPGEGTCIEVRWPAPEVTA
jgi:PAS domain S-box-containing protein